jgi:hypothetical protein
VHTRTSLCTSASSRTRPHPRRHARTAPAHLRARQPRDAALRQGQRRAVRLPKHGRGVRRARVAEHARASARGHRVRARRARDGPGIRGRRGVRRAGAGAGEAAAVGERAHVPRARVRGGCARQVRGVPGILSASKRGIKCTDRAVSAPADIHACFTTHRIRSFIHPRDRLNAAFGCGLCTAI